MVSEHDNCTESDFSMGRYCTPMDQIHHPITIVEERFFGECDIRNGDEFLLVGPSVLIGLDPSASCGTIHKM